MSKKAKAKVSVEQNNNDVVSVEQTIDTTLASLTGKSAQIRYLDSLGWSRKDIVSKLSSIYGKDIRYQHVRNVLVTQLKKDMTK